MNKPKTHIYGAVILSLIIVAGTVYEFHLAALKPQLETIAVAQADVTQGVKVSGTVKSSQDLNLAFEQGGSIARVNVKAGDKVTKGQVLVELDNSQVSAGLNQASAAVQASQATYNKLLNGATNQDVAVAEVALQNASTTLANIIGQQSTAVQNAYNTLLNTSISAVPAAGNTDTVLPIVTGTYTGSGQGSYKISLYQTGGGLKFQTNGLETAGGNVLNQPTAMGSSGLYLQFFTTPSASDSWTVTLPNTYAASYTLNYNAYQSALQNQKAAVDAAQSLVNSAQANLNLKQTGARPEDISASQAQLAASRAQYQMAQTTFSHGQMTAPIDGVVTEVNAKVGQTVAGSTLAPGAPIVKMISDQKFQIETYVAETEIGKIKVGDSAGVTLDAYGSGTNFDASVIEIDPAATILSGVSTYKVTLQFNNDDPRVRTGMGANITITDEVHKNVLAIPASSLLNDNGKTYVLVETDSGLTKKTEVNTGSVGVNGLAEITSGLSAGQKIVTFGN